MGWRKVCHRVSRGTEMGLNLLLRTEAPIAFGQIPMGCPAKRCGTLAGGRYILDGHLAHAHNSTAPPFSNNSQPLDRNKIYGKDCWCKHAMHTDQD